jgi:hypothetical protein
VDETGLADVRREKVFGVGGSREMQCVEIVRQTQWRRGQRSQDAASGHRAQISRRKSSLLVDEPVQLARDLPVLRISILCPGSRLRALKRSGTAKQF